METEKLRWFTVVAQTGHLRRAAEMLQIAPGSLSKAIRALEDELKTRLVQSSGRSIVLTEAGRRIAQQSGAVLEAVSRLSSVSRVTTQKPVKIASFEVFTSAILPHVLSQLDGTQHWMMLEAVPGAIEAALLEGRADIGLTYAPVPSPDLDFLMVGLLHFGIYGNSRLLELHSFEDLPFAAPVTQVQGDVEQIRTLDGWPEDWPRKVLFHFELLESALAMADSGKAVLYCPSVAVHLRNRNRNPANRLQRRENPRGFPTQSRRVYLVKRKSDAEDRFLKRFAKELRLALKADERMER